jgi:hypothetical protein
MHLSHAELLELKRWNTPTIYNGWEQITRRNPGKEGINLKNAGIPPQMGPMVYAVTLLIEPSNPSTAVVVQMPGRVPALCGSSGPKIVSSRIWISRRSDLLGNEQQHSPLSGHGVRSRWPIRSG